MSGVLVFLHGHDDTAERWKGAAEAMAPAGWVVERPAGPLATPNGFAWFGADEDGAPIAEQVHAGLDAVEAAVDEAARRHGTDPSGITLAGFSQGGALALLRAMRPGARPLAAVVAIAAWLPDVDGLVPSGERLGAARLLVAHGADDDVVPLPLGRSVARLLDRLGHDVTFVEHEVGHDPSPFAGDVRAWLAGSV